MKCRKKGCQSDSMRMFVLCESHKKEWDSTKESAEADQLALNSLKTNLAPEERQQLTTAAFKLFEAYLNEEVIYSKI